MTKYETSMQARVDLLTDVVTPVPLWCNDVVSFAILGSCFVFHGSGAAKWESRGRPVNNESKDAELQLRAIYSLVFVSSVYACACVSLKNMAHILLNTY